MEIATARQLYESIRQSSVSELRGIFIDRAVGYAQWRVEWLVADREERGRLDQARTRAHDAFIDTCNMMARAMKAAGEDASWRDDLGQDRKLIGDFACYIHLFLGLQAR